jgi:hypothetical protein
MRFGSAQKVTKVPSIIGTFCQISGISRSLYDAPAIEHKFLQASQLRLAFFVSFCRSFWA